MQTTLTIKGTHCNSCKALIEDVCTEIPGINSCNVDFKTGITAIEHEEKVDWQKFKKEVESLGEYKVEINQ
jgi:copper chaperone CopZ